MGKTTEIVIPFTDEELMEIHRVVADNLLSTPDAYRRHKLANILPKPIKRMLVPENRDPLTALPTLGRQLAATIIETSGDAIYTESEELAKELTAIAFARQLILISEKNLGIKPKPYKSETVNPLADQLQKQAEIMASTFASPNFTPALGRHTLEVMAPEINELVHPGRRKLREAMEAVRDCHVVRQLADSSQ